MFAPGTTLRLREPQGTEDAPHPYDRVLVVGQSPVQHATSSGSMWAGNDAVGYIIRPLSDFAPTLDKPSGELNDLYEVESYPTDPATGEPIRPENNPLNRPSPEQALAQAAREAEPAPPPRERVPSLQDDRRTPEQVLRQQPAPRGKRKPKTDE